MMSDNLIIPRQFVVDLRAAKIQQLRALKVEIAQYDRWLALTSGRPVNDGVPIPPEPNVTCLGAGRVKGSEWS